LLEKKFNENLPDEICDSIMTQLESLLKILTNYLRGCTNYQLE